MNNQAIFRELMAARKIDVRDSEIFGREFKHKGAVDFDRIEGMMLGLAIGDALGNTSESMTPERRAHHFGEITDYLGDRFAGGNKGLPSDDTQMAAWTLECILHDGGYVPENVAKVFAGREIFGIGKAVSEFVHNYRSGMKWHEVGRKRLSDEDRADRHTAPEK